MKTSSTYSQDIINILKNGGVGVIPTDTIYGIVGSAFSPTVVEKIYDLKKRNPQKALIILISDMSELERFDIKVSPEEKKVLDGVWPGPTSVILSCSSEKFSYLHRGEKSLAFRMPKKESLRKFLEEAGPLVAPSANVEGEKPAEDISEAQRYFGESVDFYIDEGKLVGSPSALIKIENSTVISLR